MAKKKRKYFIDEREAVELLQEGYGFDVRILNFYTIRISHEEHPGVFFDWFHTQGTLCKTENGACQNLGTIGDTEDVALFIKKQI